MFGKKECYLCGGKLSNGRCTECGLDNTKVERKTYRLNEESSQKKMRYTGGNDSKREERIQSSAPVPSAGGKYSSPSGNIYTARGSQNTGGPAYAPNMPGNRPRQIPRKPVKRRRGGCLLAIVIVGVMLVAVAGPLFYAVQDIYYDITDGQGFFESIVDEDSTEYDYDPYEYVERELSETGESFGAELTGGEYTVGTHIPEGTYTVELMDGTGSMNITDDENGIYLYEYFGYEEEYEEITYKEDVRLYTGAVVSIDPGVSLHFQTENGQTELVQWEENPLTDSVVLEAGIEYIAGEDFPAGVYDLSGSPWSEVQYEVYIGDVYDDEELNYEITYLYFEEGEQGSYYRNAVLPEGTSIISEDMLNMAPSEKITDQDYAGYYSYY